MTINPAMPLLERDGAKTSIAAWAMLAVLLLASVLSFLDRTMLALLVAPIQAELRLDDMQLALLLGPAFGIFYAVSAYPMGWLVDRSSRRRIVALGITSWSLATMASGFADNFASLFTCRLVVGLGEATLYPAAYSMISDAFPTRRLTLAISVFSLGSALGGGIAHMLGGIGFEAALAHPLSLPGLGVLSPWQTAFFAAGVAGLAIGPLLFLIPEPGRKQSAAMPESAGLDHGTRQPAPLGEFVRLRRSYLLLTSLGMAVFVMLAYGLAAWFPTYLVRNFGLPIGDIGLLCGTVALVCGPAGYLACGWLADRWLARGGKDAHLRLAVGALGTAAVVVTAGLALQQPLYLTIAAYAVVQFLLPAMQLLTAHLQLATPAGLRGRISALFGLFYNLVGLVLGPVLVIWISTLIFGGDPRSLGSSMALGFAVLVPLGACFLILGLPGARAALHRK